MAKPRLLLCKRKEEGELFFSFSSFNPWLHPKCQQMSTLTPPLLQRENGRFPFTPPKKVVASASAVMPTVSQDKHPPKVNRGRIRGWLIPRKNTTTLGLSSQAGWQAGWILQQQQENTYADTVCANLHNVSCVKSSFAHFASLARKNYLFIYKKYSFYR